MATTPKIRPQIGPKPTGWITIEIGDHLLVGEQIDGQWRWECDTLPDFVGTTPTASSTMLTKFIKAASRRPKGAGYV